MTVHLLFMWSHIALCVKFGTSPFFLGFFLPQEFNWRLAQTDEYLVVSHVATYFHLGM